MIAEEKLQQLENEHVSFKLKVRGVGYDQIKPMLVTSDALLDALKILGVEVRDYADAQAQAIADLYYDASDHVEVRWGWVSGGGGNYFYPCCPTCRKTRNFCSCSSETKVPGPQNDLRERVRNYEMAYGPGQLNKSVYLAGAIFSYRGYHYILYPSKLRDPAPPSLDDHFYAVIFLDEEISPVDLTPNFDSAWNVHKTAEIMINDLTKGEPE